MPPGRLSAPNGGPEDLEFTMSMQSIGVLLSLTLASSAIAQEAVQWRVEDGGNGHWYQGIIADGITWTEARATANSIGGDLVTLTSVAESGFVFSAIASNAMLWQNRVGPWIGLLQARTALEPAEGWRWCDGSPLTFDLWHPNGIGGGSNPIEWGPCIDADFGAYYCWVNDPTVESCPMNTWGSYQDSHDPECHWEPYRSFIVEWSADCNNDGIVDYGQIRDGSLDDLDANNVPDCCEQEIDYGLTTPVQWRAEDGGNGHWYQFVRGPSQVCWVEARDGAAERGGHLVSITNGAESAFVTALVVPHDLGDGAPGPYIGATCEGRPWGDWYWLSGEPFSYTNWNSGEPNSGGGELYVHLFSWSSGLRWNDTDAGEPPSFIIEWSADCNSDGIVDFGQIRDGTLDDLDANGVPDCCDAGEPCDTNLIQNGGFESGPDQACGWICIGTGGTELYDWQVTLNSVDRQRTEPPDCMPESWLAFEGAHSVDLNGCSVGGMIEQSIRTTPGRRYELSVQLTLNAGWHRGDLRIHAAGQHADFEVLRVDAPIQPWSKKIVQFTATSASTVIAFESLNREFVGQWAGPVIDDARVLALPDRCDSETDSDNDGTPDCNDGCPTDPNKTAPGACGCGIADTDNDNDGTADCNDGCPTDPNKTAPGACGCGIADTDSDNDGIADCVDAEFVLSLEQYCAAVAKGNTLCVRVSSSWPLVAAPDRVTAVQLAVVFDATRLRLDSVNNAIEGGPFDLELVELIDNEAGTLRYAVGIADFLGGGMFGPSPIVELHFTVLDGVSDCAAEELLDIVPNIEQVITRLTTQVGGEVVVSVPIDLPLPPIALDFDPPVIEGLPESIAIATDAGSLFGGTVLEPTVTASDACDAEVTVAMLIAYPDGSTSTVWPADNRFPRADGGVSTVQITATDDAGNFSVATLTITVGDYQLLDASVHFVGEFSRQAEFHNRSVSLSTGEFSQVLSVEIDPTTQSGAMHDLQVPVAVSYGCALAKDTEHSLSDIAEPSIVGTKYAASFELLQGDSNGDDLVDVIDFGYFVLDFGPAFADGRSNFNGDGNVTNADFTFISINFWKQGETCGGAVTGNGPRARVTVKELRRAGNGQLAVADLNGDGWVDAQDIAHYLEHGVVRVAEPERARVPRW